MISELAQIRHTHTASMQILKRLLLRFPSPARAYLDQAIEQGWIMDGPDSIFNRVKVKPVSLRIEQPQPPTE